MMAKVLMSPRERDAAGVLMAPVDDRFGYVAPPEGDEEPRWYKNGSTLYAEVLDRYAHKDLSKADE